MWSEHFGEEATSPQDREIMAEWDSVIDNWYDQALANGQGFKSEEEEKKAYLDSLGDPLDHPMFATTAEQIARHPLGDVSTQRKKIKQHTSLRSCTRTRATSS